MLKITFNALKIKRDKLGRKLYVWRQPKGKGKKPSKSQIKEFKSLRRKASLKREKTKREFKKQFKEFDFKTRNLIYKTYCKKFNNRKGINDLQRLFQILGLAKKLTSPKFRLRFFVGEWDGFCTDDSVDCPKRRFIAHKRKDRYKMSREQERTTNNNFIDQYINYLVEAQDQAAAIYRDEVCSQCPSGSVGVEFISICFQFIRVLRET
jgi:hypothetical protein